MDPSSKIFRKFQNLSNCIWNFINLKIPNLPILNKILFYLNFHSSFSFNSNRKIKIIVTLSDIESFNTKQYKNWYQRNDEFLSKTDCQ